MRINKKFLYSFIINIMLITISGILLFYNHNLRVKNNEYKEVIENKTAIIEQKTEEITKLSNDIKLYDGVKNNIDSITKTVYTNKTTVLKDKASDDSKNISEYVINTQLRKIGTEGKYTIILSDDGSFHYINSDDLSNEKTIIKKQVLPSPVSYKKATGNTKVYQDYAYSLFASYNWSDEDLLCLINLWNRESGWNPYATNSSSGAYGIPQSLPASKMAAFGSDYLTNYKTQIQWGLNYISNRYGSPTNAWAHFQSHNWY